jgi:hypothetical protein
MTSCQYSVAGISPARALQVRSNTLLSISIAMSQRMPSHCNAIESTVAIAAARKPALNALT